MEDQRGKKPELWNRDVNTKSDQKDGILVKGNYDDENGDHRSRSKLPSFLFLGNW
ncbi:hypothetical protein TWF730_009268 [Orbilia blumenaviensis]|uniref:Uncharacterized protein n=1 Tax=Orbilia blumenaviensis TaxID=1796055 RepID=A0AAV9V0J5_9PEZI